MKTIGLISTLIFAISATLLAQPKYTSNYSFGNYKMSKNAKNAKELNLDDTKEYQYKESPSVDQGRNNNSNYKNSFARVENDGGNLPVLPTETTLADTGNEYKSQFRGTQKVKNTSTEPAQRTIVNAKENNDGN